ncbi:MAG: CHAT domain-containing tetratricopeptide repeat protein [Stellaceae bacterium]
MLGAAMLGFGVWAAAPALSQSTAGNAPEAQAFTPPPRSIADITAILDREKPDPAKVAEANKRADAQPPSGASDVELQKFYSDRAEAADNLGRSQQAIADYTKAVELAARNQGNDLLTYADALKNLARANRRAGNYQVSLKLTDQYVDLVQKYGQKQGRLFTAYEEKALDAARSGDFATADDWLRRIDLLKQASGSWRLGQNYRNYYAASTNRAHGEVALFKGNLAEAEAMLRNAVDEARQEEIDSVGESYPPRGTYIVMADFIDEQLANVLNREGRPLEAEFEARRALLSELQLHGRYSGDTVAAITSLGGVIAEQGRFKDAETLARTALSTYQTLGIDQSSLMLNNARVVLASTLVAERRWTEALAQFDTIRKGLANNPAALKNALGQTLDLPMADLHGGRAQDALQVSRAAFDTRSQVLGENRYSTAEAEGLLAASLAATGGMAEAKQHFAHAVPILIGGGRTTTDTEDAAPGLKDERLKSIIEAYLGVLAADKSAASAAEAFHVADAVRGRAVQRALASAAARANVSDPALAAVIRKDQDNQREMQALAALLANDMALPDGQRDDKAIAQMRAQFDQLRDGRKDSREQIAQKFPEYTKLIDPQPATVEQVQAALKPGEALFAVYAGDEKSYVWAVPKDGAISFATANLTHDGIGQMVKELRKALDPDADTLAQIPAFRVDLAYKLYAALLEPVKPGWQNAKSLLVVPHGALGQLPFALLVTQNAPVAADSGQAPFAGYKKTAWLVRQVAITQLPSVTSLTTLRAVPPAPAGREPFIGFGDPWFNAKEAAAGEREDNIANNNTQLASADTGGEIATRGGKIHLRSAPQTEGDNTATLAQLPRLPDTAAEVRQVAEALKADSTHDVFLGAAANERTVRTTKLDNRRVVMFATHGLVPGDLDGLTEPALALSAPSIAHVEGNGLLTVSKILGLQLNADWVVLSACNTASGGGAGAEAVSGLGMAFFYAGSRALLVSNWPVETTSARELTTGLFKRQASNADPTRAEALRQSELALIDGPGYVDPATKKTLFSYAHPLFWAPFSLVGDGS